MIKKCCCCSIETGVKLILAYTWWNGVPMIWAIITTIYEMNLMADIKAGTLKGEDIPEVVVTIMKLTRVVRLFAFTIFDGPIRLVFLSIMVCCRRKSITMRKVVFWLWTICSIYYWIIFVVTMATWDPKERGDYPVHQFWLKVCYIIVDIYAACIFWSFSKQSESPPVHPEDLELV